MRNEPGNIRETLRAWVRDKQPHSDGDVLVDELCFVDKRRRADLVHANGRLSAYEIKSSADTLARWGDQQEAYLRVFDHLWLCVHPKHIESALSSSHRSVGLLVVDDYESLAMIRKPKDHGKVSAYDLAGLLWREELDFLCKEHGLSTNKREKIAVVRQRISDSLPLGVIKERVLERLKLRYKKNCL